MDLRIPNGKPGREGGEALQRYARQLDSGIITLVTLPELDWTTRKAAWFCRPRRSRGAPSSSTPPNGNACPTGIGQRLARQQQGQRRSPRLHRRSRRGQPPRRPPGNPQAWPAPPPGELESGRPYAAPCSTWPATTSTACARPCSKATPARCSAPPRRPARAKGKPRPWCYGPSPPRYAASPTCGQGLDDGQPAAGAVEGRADLTTNAAARRTQKALGRLAAPQLQTSILHAAKIDRMIKGLADGDVWDEFLQLCLRLTRARPGAALTPPGHPTTSRETMDIKTYMQTVGRQAREASAQRGRRLHRRQEQGPPRRWPPRSAPAPRNSSKPTSATSTKPAPTASSRR